MSENHQVQCEVVFGASANPLGVFANAIRIVHDQGDEFFLDFVVYSSAVHKAELVSRVRVTRSFLSTVHHRLGLTVEELQNGRTESDIHVLATFKKDDSVN